MTTIVLDAHALMAYLEGEPGADRVSALLTDAAAGKIRLLMTVVNIGEVYYIVLRERGEDALARVKAALAMLPIDMVDVDLPLVAAAAAFKARRHMSYADCFAAALAQTHGADIVTGDPEFHSVEDEITVRWLR